MKRGLLLRRRRGDTQLPAAGRPSLADEKGGVVDVTLEDDLLAARGDALGAREGGDGPDERAEELHRDEDGGDDELRLGADVGRPPRRLRRRLEDPRDPVCLGQEGAVHGAEAHAHREPAGRAGRNGSRLVRYSSWHSTQGCLMLSYHSTRNLRPFDVISALSSSPLFIHSLITIPRGMVLMQSKSCFLPYSSCILQSCFNKRQLCTVY